MHQTGLAILVSWFLSGGCALAQQPEVSERDPPDFSEGFALLAGLGVPDTRDAIWVKFPTEDTRGWHGSELDPSPLENGAWFMQKPTPEASQHLIIAQVRDEIALSESAYEKLLQETRARYGEEAPWALGEHWLETGWEQIPLTGTVTEVLGYLAETKTKLKAGGEMEWLRDQVPLPEMLLFATHLWKRGMIAEANRVAHAALQFTVEPTLTIDQVITILANQALSDVTASFEADQNWSRYAEGLATLLARFPRGWNLLDAAQRLHGMAERRARAPIPVDLTYFREPFPEGAADILQRFVDERQSGTPAAPDFDNSAEDPEGAGFRTSLWTLEPPQDTGGASGEIVSRGIEGVMLLTPLIGDGALTPTFRSKVDAQRQVYFPSSNNSNDLSQQFDEIQRPLTRSELAEVYLRPVVPEELLTGADGEWGGILQSLLFAWCKEMRGQPAHALALSYLEKGSSAQRRSAFRLLEDRKEPEVKERMETAILALLDTDSKWNDALSLAKLYIAKRGDGSAEFFQRFKAKFAPLIDAAVDAAQQPYEREQYEPFKTELVKLEGVLEGQALRLLLQALETDETDESWNRGLAGVYSYWSEASAADRERDAMQLIEGIAALTQAKRRERLFDIVFSWMNQMVAGDDADSAETLEVLASMRRGFLSEELRAAWEKLLADATPVSSHWDGYAGTLGELSALLLLVVHLTPDDYRQLSLAAGILGEESGAVIKTMAEAYLRGREPDRPWPRADRVDEARGGEIFEQLKTLAAADMRGWLASLNIDEKLHLQVRLSEIESIPETWLERIQQIEEVKVTDEAAMKAHDWAALQGRRMTSALFEELVAALRTGDPLSDAYVWVRSRGFGRGLEVVSGNSDDAWLEDLNHPDFSGHLRIVVGDERSQPAFAAWNAESDKPVFGEEVEFTRRLHEAIKQSDFRMGIRVLPREGGEDDVKDDEEAGLEEDE